MLAGVGAAMFVLGLFVGLIIVSVAMVVLPPHPPPKDEKKGDVKCPRCDQESEPLCPNCFKPLKDRNPFCRNCKRLASTALCRFCGTDMMGRMMEPRGSLGG